MPNLDPFGPRLKLTRAKRHIRDLASLFESFVSDNPHRVEFHEDEDGVSVVAIFDRPLPNETAPIIGDAIHNLRSALDHLAAQAVIASGETPTRNTGFPIYKAEADFNGGVTSKLSGASVSFVDFVKTLKPYQTAADGTPGSIHLWTLSQLDNLDKHLVILPTISVVTLRNIKVTTESGGALTIGTLNVSGNGNIARIAGKGAKYEADRDASFGVRFANTNLVDGEDVVGILTALEKTVEGIIGDASRVDI